MNRPAAETSFGPPPDLSAYPAVWQAPGAFAFDSGASLPAVRQVFGHYGRLNEARDNAVLVTTGISASYHAAAHPSRPEPGWWSRMIGPGLPLDTNRYFVVCFNPLGGCFGSSGPGSVDPESGRRYGTRFPALTVRDMMRAQHGALRALGIERLRAAIGSSMGGMLALQLAADHPDFVDRLLAISCTARSSAYSIGFRYAQRVAIQSDPAWQGGDYEPGLPPLAGLRAARMIGTLAYRSPRELNPRFGRERVAEEEHFGVRYEVESWLAHQADNFARNFDANSYLYLTRAIDDFDLGAGFESTAAGVARIKARTTVVGVDSDLLFPIEEQRELHVLLHRARPATRFRRVQTSSGHDAFLKDYEIFQPLVREFMEEE